MKQLFSVALLCLSISAFSQTLPRIPYSLTASQYPNAANIYYVAPGRPFTLTYKMFSQIGTNVRTVIQQNITGPAVSTTLGTIPNAEL